MNRYDGVEWYDDVASEYRERNDGDKHRQRNATKIQVGKKKFQTK